MAAPRRAPSPVDYSKDVEAYPVEIWHDYT